MGGSSFVSLVTRKGIYEEGQSSRLSLPVTFLSRFRAALKTWRGTTLAGLIVTSLVFIVNLGFLLWVVSKRNAQTINGLQVIATGSDREIHAISVALHLLINLFSNLLLGASSYCMQALSSPTREDVDKAHRRGKWLSIGTFTLRNFRFIPWKRTACCLFLAITSVPLAFLYNATIVELSTANTYLAAIVSEDIFQDGPRIPSDPLVESIDPLNWNATCTDPVMINSCANSAVGYWQAISFFSDGNGGFRNLTRLEPEHCHDIYQKENRLTDYRNVLLVTKDAPSNMSQNVFTTWNTRYMQGYGFGVGNDASAFCNGDEDRVCHYTGPDDWYVAYWTSHPETLLFTKIDYCMAERVEVPSNLGLSLPIMLVVVGCNLVKATILLYGLLSLNFTPMVTVGDALDSFLSEEDPTTCHQSALSIVDVKRGYWSSESCLAGRAGRIWENQRHFWARAASPWRWLLTMVIGGWTFLAGLGYIVSATRYDAGFDSFGRTEGQSLFKLESYSLGPITNAVIANVPQMLISLAYLFYNGVFTSMCLVQEFSSFVLHRKGLRVSQPRKHQRGSHFLSMPFRYSAPLMCLMIVLHWLVSQAIFPVYITNYDTYGQPITDTSTSFVSASVDTFGYSNLAIVLSVTLGGIILLSLPLIGASKYPHGFVVAGSCSAALSAACHPPRNTKIISLATNSIDQKSIDQNSFGTEKEDEDIGGQLLQYGVLDDPSVSNAEQLPKRIGFSAGPVQPLRTGEVYEAPAKLPNRISYPTRPTGFPNRLSSSISSPVRSENSSEFEFGSGISDEFLPLPSSARSAVECV